MKSASAAASSLSTLNSQLSTMKTSALGAARLRLVLDAPFFGTLAFKLDTNTDPGVPTSHTDGRSIRIHPQFMAGLTSPQLAGVLCENILHCAMGHLWRRGNRDLELWNKAADQAAWNMLADFGAAADGRIALPPSAIPDTRFAGMSVEEIYHAMQQGGQGNQGGNSQDQQPQPYQSPGQFDQPAPDPTPGQGDAPSDGGSEGQGQPDQGDGDGDGDGGGDGDGEGAGCQADSLEAEWKNAVTQAATVARQQQQGNLPAWMKALVDELIHPKVPWQDHLREFCHRLSRDDYSFRRPNRRFLSRGIILPSLHSERLGRIVCAFDTSGSIFGHMELVRDILSELQGVLDLCRPERLTLISCDAAIHQQQDFLPGDSLLDFHPEGGGGTDFRPVFTELANENDEPPAALIYLTDLEGSFPAAAPEYPVLWANFGQPRRKAPFGTTIPTAFTS